MQRHKTVDEFLKANPEWEAELAVLRRVLQASEMQETVKWGIPTYTVNGKNVAGIGAFKTYVGVWFFQGVFLEDKYQKLINAQEGKTKGMRQWRFNSADDIDQALLAEYLNEAVANQQAGKEIKPARNAGLVIPEALQQALTDSPELRQAFAALTPGKQREYAGYISGAKREGTRISRLEKSIPMVLAGAGLHDKYRNC